MLEDLPMEMKKDAIECFLKERMGEVLDSWCFLGYTKSGELVSDFNAPTDRDQSALNAEYQDWAEEMLSPDEDDEEEPAGPE